ncbi:MAG: phenylalanine--tRNA ligase subunit beta [Deltaproteobacteria bacterium]|nr:MAG: phenylalanine--tRNA ligase subunit beta [Deltaproteobacteria bacterium]
MKILWSWLTEFIDTRLSPAHVQEALTMAGVEVSSCRFLGEGLDSVVTARILAMGQHPNADRLSVCRVTDGMAEYDIVCGARNMKAGDAVALAKVGARLPNGVEIRKAKIRGRQSEGMLCSEQELKFAEESAGIMILAEDTVPGRPLAEALGLSDWLLEVEITPNRGDCLSVLGVAREIASVTGEKVRLPDVSVREDGAPIESLVSIDVSDPGLCPRYTARAVTGVKVGPSPDWMRRRLAFCGIRPINNVVDVTNYLLLETGQPMHAFDLERLRGARIDVKAPTEPMTFTTLDGAERKIEPGMLLIRDGAGPVAVAGIMGGLNSEVTDGTTKVLFESAHFAPASIRRTGRRLGLSSESSYRFERGVDPAGTLFAADRAVSLLGRISPVIAAKGIIDIGAGVSHERSVRFRPGRAGRIIGREYTPEECSGIFARLGFPTAGAGGGEWRVTVPSRRFDIEREIDLVEEIARLSGYDGIPTAYPESKAPDFSAADRFVDISERACGYLQGRGFHQAVNFSFVSGRRWERMGKLFGFDAGDAVRVKNPISDETTLMRPHLLSGLLQNVSDNLRRFIEDVRLYESGKAYGKRFVDGHFEEHRMGIVLCGRRLPGEWTGGSAPVDFYDMKGVAEPLLHFLGSGPVHVVPTRQRPFLEEGKAADIVCGGEVVGWFGAIRRELLSEYEIASPVFYGEIRLEAATATPPPPGAYRPLPKFPPVFRDVACVFPDTVPVGDVLSMVREVGAEIEDASVFDVFTGEKIGEGKKSVAIRVKLQPSDRTLTDADVNSIHTKIVNLLENRFGGKIRTA